MNLSNTDRATWLQRLCEAEGMELEQLLAAATFDSVAPAICVACGATAEMEPDQDRGYCESCGGSTVISGLVLAGLI